MTSYVEVERVDEYLKSLPESERLELAALLVGPRYKVLSQDDLDAMPATIRKPKPPSDKPILPVDGVQPVLHYRYEVYCSKPIEIMVGRHNAREVLESYTKAMSWLWKAYEELR